MYIKVHAMPGAKKESIVQRSPDAYDISVREPAERNLANGRIREVLAAQLGVSRASVKLVTGHRSPHKIFSVDISY